MVCRCPCTLQCAVVTVPCLLSLYPSAHVPLSLYPLHVLLPLCTLLPNASAHASVPHSSQELPYSSQFLNCMTKFSGT